MSDLLVPTWPLRPHAVSRLPVGWRPVRRLTILTPLHREAQATIDRSARAVRSLAYPVELVQVLWLVAAGPAGEWDARRARTAMAANRVRGLDWRLVRVPQMSPKGAALNHAFPLAGGEVIAIVDADVVPAPQQPAEAVWALEQGCDLVQAEEVSEPSPSLVARVKAAEEAMWHASVRGLARTAGVHVVAGSSVYAWASTWDQVRPVWSEDVEESYHWSLRFMGSATRTGFLPSSSTVSATDDPLAALRQRARWTRGQLRAVAVNWRTLPARGRLLGAISVGGLAARATLPVLSAAAIRFARVRKPAAVLLLADLACALGAMGTAEYRRRADAVAWALVVPWHLVGAVAVYRAVAEWARGERSWHSVRALADDPLETVEGNVAAEDDP